jgi:hypothetical protein
VQNVTEFADKTKKSQIYILSCNFNQLIEVLQTGSPPPSSRNGQVRRFVIALVIEKFTDAPADSQGAKNSACCPD